METLSANYIKKLISTALLTFGMCGLLYTMPYIVNGFQSNTDSMFFFFIISIIPSILSLVLHLVKSKKNSHLNFLIPKDLNWRKTINLLIISLIVSFAPLIFKNPTPGYAPHSFAYNIGFLIPTQITSFIVSFIGLVVGAEIFRKKNVNLSFKIVPLIPLMTIVIIMGLKIKALF